MGTVNPRRIETRLTDKFRRDEEKKLVLEYGTAQRESGLLYGRVANRLRPGSVELLGVRRRRIAAERIGRPVNALVPDLTARFTADPSRQPYSAGGFCWVLNSCTESRGNSSTAAALLGSVDEDVAGRQVELSYAFDQYNVSSLAPAIGGRGRPVASRHVHHAGAQLEQLEEVTGFQGQVRQPAWLVTVPPRVAFVVSIAGASALTVTVWVCSPGDRVRSTRTSEATSSSTLVCSVPSGIPWPRLAPCRCRKASWEPYTRRLRRSSTFAWYREPRR